MHGHEEGLPRTAGNQYLPRWIRANAVLAQQLFGDRRTQLIQSRPGRVVGGPGVERTLRRCAHMECGGQVQIEGAQIEERYAARG